MFDKQDGIFAHGEVRKMFLHGVSLVVGGLYLGAGIAKASPLLIVSGIVLTAIAVVGQAFLCALIWVKGQLYEADYQANFRDSIRRLDGARLERFLDDIESRGADPDGLGPEWDR